MLKIKQISAQIQNGIQESRSNAEGALEMFDKIKQELREKFLKFDQN